MARRAVSKAPGRDFMLRASAAALTRRAVRNCYRHALGSVLGSHAQVSAYIASTWALAGGVLWLTIQVPSGAADWAPWGAGLLLVFAIFSERLAVEVPNRETDEVYTVSVATIPQIMCVLLLPPALGAGIASLAMLIDELRNRRSVARILFNTAATACSVGLTALMGNQLGLIGRQLVTGNWKEVLAVLLESEQK